MTVCLYSFGIGTSKSKKALFTQFLNEFEAVELPSKQVLDAPRLRLEKAKKIEYKNPKTVSNILSTEYVSFIPGIKSRMMSRMGPSTYKAKWLLKDKADFYTVIYSITHPYNRSIDYCVATFDTKGNSIDTHYLDVDTYETPHLRFEKNKTIYPVDKNNRKVKEAVVQIDSKGAIVG